MKKQLIKTSLFSCVATLAFLFPSFQTGTLKDITKPYLGEYECESVTLGEKDYLENFAFIRLELEKGETFVLRYKTKDGQTGEEKGTYVYDDREHAICLSMGKNGEWKRKIPIKKGKLNLSFPIGTQLFSMEFKQK